MVWPFGIPDLRVDVFNIPGLMPAYTKKAYIKDPENYNKKRDFLVNLYFSTPDYVDPHKKVAYSALFGAKFAFAFGAMEVCAQKSRNYERALTIMGRSFLLLGGSCLTYGAVTTAMANLRGKKDDLWNHVLGGGSVGFIWGFYTRSSGLGSVAGAACATIAILLKAFQTNDKYILHPDHKRELNSPWGEEIDLRFGRFCEDYGPRRETYKY